MVCTIVCLMEVLQPQSMLLPCCSSYQSRPLHDCQQILGASGMSIDCLHAQHGRKVGLWVCRSPHMSFAVSRNCILLLLHKSLPLPWRG